MKSSRARLLHDLKEIEQNPLPTVACAPVGDDLSLWHANLLGIPSSPYAGAVFHLELSFPDSYPSQAPSVRVLTPIPHPHVHGDKMCLDLLSDFDGYFKRSASKDSLHTGWSPAYSVLSILLQLQAFVLEIDDDDEAHSDSNDEDDQDAHSNLEQILISIPQAVRASRSFKCSKCQHHAPNKIFPPFMKEDLGLSRSADEHGDSLVCFHSKVSWRDEILGLGVHIEHKGRSDRIARIHTGLDILSWNAFSKGGVRSGILSKKSEKDAWTHFIPLWINEEHGQRALDCFKRVLCSLNTVSGDLDRFRPQWAFAMVQKLMNHFIVQIMKGDMFASERALEGYCYFHRWLLFFAQEYPGIVEAKMAVMEDFIRDPEKRRKKVVPDLGEFITLLTLDVKFKWADLKEAYLSECYARNAFWNVDVYPELGKPEFIPSVERVRPELTFESSLVSLRLCLFHVYFLEHVGRPPDMTGIEVAKRYDSRLGRPSRKMRQQWQIACKEILAVSSWDEYRKYLGDPPMSRSQLTEYLREIMMTSPYKAQGQSRRNNNGSGRKWK